MYSSFVIHLHFCKSISYIHVIVSGDQKLPTAALRLVRGFTNAGGSVLTCAWPALVPVDGDRPASPARALAAVGLRRVSICMPGQLDTAHCMQM